MTLNFLVSGEMVVLCGRKRMDEANTILSGVVTEIVNPVYKVVTAITFVYFMYGVVKYMYDMRNPQDKNTGKQHLLWGTIGLFIIFSIGGIFSIFDGIFGSLGLE